MGDSSLPPWPTTVAAARELQLRLQPQVIAEDQFGPVNFVAGTDVGFAEGGTITRAAVAVLSFPELALVDHALAEQPTCFPYVPGYLSFRELPAILEALDRLQQAPDLLLCDGQGLAHPRRFGIACHLGVVTGLPSIGVAKTRLIGTHDDVGPSKGCRVPLVDKGEMIGAVLRTRDRVRPLYISSGHRVGLDSACDFVMRCLTRYRLPETTRWADKLASRR